MEFVCGWAAEGLLERVSEWTNERVGMRKKTEEKS